MRHRDFVLSLYGVIKIKSLGYNSTLVTVMIFFTLGLLLLTGLHRELDREISITNDEQFYLRAYNQAASSLSWGLSCSWPLKLPLHTKSERNTAWHCEIQSTHGLKACIKPVVASRNFLLKGESSLTDRLRKVILYQQVIPEIAHSTADAQKIVGLAHGWLDFCPEKDEKLCAD